MSDDTRALDDDGGWIDPHACLSLALVLSLLLWAPFGLAVLRSELNVLDGLLRYLVAFVGCRLAVGGIVHLAGTYRSERVRVEAVPSPETVAE